ncbi:hypothetical protein GCM10007391_10170 [Alteromonas halophila]|uniref:Uncharacterized protein n=1 Tax=Alteromonas halophila TaxID=516698 RepID=A0A918JG56_9ALTE|nr:hypothetical protein GCM10007391_10170 [Alteromonas halophila]
MLADAPIEALSTKLSMKSAFTLIFVVSEYGARKLKIQPITDDSLRCFSDRQPYAIFGCLYNMVLTFL